MFSSTNGRAIRPAAVLASLAAIATLGAGLIAPTASAAESTKKTTDDATFAWSLNKESNYRAYAPGTFNFLSAGVVDKTSASDSVTEDEWKQSDGNVSIEKQQADGSYAAATWKGLQTTPDGKDLPAAYVNGEDSGNRVKLTKGTGTIDADKDDASISWTGSFTVVFYSGLAQWYAKDLKLNVTGGKGTVTATLGGWATDMNDTSKFAVLDEEKDVEIATLSNVDVKDDGTVVTPDFNEIDVDGQGTKAKSWPKPFLDFVSKVGTGPYWYSSGGAADNRKAPTAITVAYTTKAAEPDPSEVGVTGTMSADPTTIDPTKDQQITVTGKGYTGAAAKYGTYVVIAEQSVWKPGEQPLDQSAFPIQKWVRPLNDPKDGYSNLDENGNWTQVLDIPANTLDASKKYSVGTFAAHALSITNRNLDHAVDLTLEVAATAPEAPAKPTATVAATMADPYQVKVDWKAPADGGSAITGYTVTLTPSKGDAVTQDVAADTTTATFGKLTAPGVSYTATVVAKNAKGASDASPASDAVTPNADPTTKPAVTVTPTKDIDPSVDNTFTVKGTGFTGGAAAYGAYAVVADSSVWTAGKNPASADDFLAAAWVKPAEIANGEFTTEVTVKAGTLQYGKTYVIGTTAAHALSLTDRRLDTATAIALKAQPQAPEAPAKPTASVPAAGQVKVDWEAPADGGSAITGYTVTLTPENGYGETVTKDAAADATTVTFDGLTVKGASYTATVVAKNKVGSSAASAKSEAVTPTEATAPAAPSDVKLTAAGVHELVAGWTAPADDGGSAITEYDVTLTSADGKDVKTQTVKAPTTAATFTDLNPALEYTASVVAKNAAGASAAATSEAAKPAAITPKLSFADADKKAITELKLNVKDVKKLNVLAEGEQVEGAQVTWTSSDETVVAFQEKTADTPATTANGYDEQTVEALKAGTATITAEATIDGQKVTATLPVTVTDPNAPKPGANNGNNNGQAGNNGQLSGNKGNKQQNALSKTGATVTGVAIAVIALAATAAGVTVLRRRHA